MYVFNETLLSVCLLPASSRPALF